METLRFRFSVVKTLASSKVGFWKEYLSDTANYSLTGQYAEEVAESDQLWGEIEMSRKVKREVSSLSFSMNKLYHRIPTLKPSIFIISLLAMAFAVSLLGGGLYDIIMKPYPAVWWGGRFTIIYPALSEQFMGDSLVAIALYALGIAGLLTIYQSTKYAYKPRQAHMTFLVGVILVFLAYMFLETMLMLKLRGT